MPRARDQRLSPVRVQQDIIPNVPRSCEDRTGGEVLHTDRRTANRWVQFSVISFLAVADSVGRDERADECCERRQKLRPKH